MPNAYEQALIEITRRRVFRTVLERDVNVLKEFVGQEMERRKQFSKNVHTYLPSSFCPALREQAPELSLEGTQSELPDVGSAL